MKKKQKQKWLDYRALAAFLMQAVEFGMTVAERVRKKRKPKGRSAAVSAAE